MSTRVTESGDLEVTCNRCGHQVVLHGMSLDQALTLGMGGVAESQPNGYTWYQCNRCSGGVE